MLFPLPEVVIATDATPNCWAFFQGSRFPSPVVVSCLVPCTRFILLCRELQPVALILCKMAYGLSGKVVSLHLDKSTTKAYICNCGGTASLFLSRLASCILNLPNRLDITLFPACTPTHLNVEADYLSLERLVPE